MELLDYIRKNYKTPNVAVLKTLGATDELIRYLINTPNNTNMKVVESLISGGGDKGNGIKSITISPAITTTPALDSLFPIYWEDLTDEEKANGVTRNLEIDSLPGGEYSITVTPTAEWYAVGIGDSEVTSENAGAPITYTQTTILDQAIVIKLGMADTLEESDEAKMVEITINIGSKQ